MSGSPNIGKNLYKNRELSWLEFEDRILNEAMDYDNLLFERLKFLSITSSNLDEFIMIRVAALANAAGCGAAILDISGMTPMEQLKEVITSIKHLKENQYKVFLNYLLPELKAERIDVRTCYEECSQTERERIDEYFDSFVYPLLTPITYEEKRPFPHIRNKYLYVGGFINRKKELEESFALVQVPKGIPRVVRFKNDNGAYAYILLEEIIKSKFNKIFNCTVSSEIGVFRVIRDGDLLLGDGDMSDPIKEIESKVEKRDLGEVICLDCSYDCSDKLLDYLCGKLNFVDRGAYKVNGPIDLTFLFELYSMDGFEKYKRPAYNPVVPAELANRENLFGKIREQDYMLVHPFESFEPVIDFINEAASDKDVLAIKQTLYRVSEDSPIIKALIKAAENGKQVTVLMELKARFDEENNIYFARKLEKAGCQVIYGFANLKTHCKITLVVRRENSKLVRYVHLGTGNYNDTTARVYTDIGFFTANPAFGEDAIKVFNMLSGLYEQERFEKLSLAPTNLRKKFLELIEREAVCADEGKPSHIIAKMNSLCDKEIIDALYNASSRGVKIELIVRGICSLRTKIEGVSDNITVRSIVGNFLEHSRIYYFKNGGNSEFYCSSADWMERNMDRRIEILFPVENPNLCKKLKHVLTLMLRDNRKAWFLQPDGSYKKMPDAAYLYSFQDGFLEEEMEQEKNK